MEDKIKWENFEPLRSNRWTITFKNCEISEYLFKRYKIFNDGNKLMFSTEIYETVMFQINPKNLFNIESISINFLDPTGGIVNGLNFTPKGILFEQVGDYGSDDILTYKLLIEIDKDTLNKTYGESKK
jgi:hypothetical protein